jgi:hypothetical protein
MLDEDSKFDLPAPLQPSVIQHPEFQAISKFCELFKMGNFSAMEALLSGNL